MTMWENITKRLHQGTKVITYQYDELNQLIRENNGVLGTTVLYTYDAGGKHDFPKDIHIQRERFQRYRHRILPIAPRGWKDQLLSWNGKSYTYDAGGNPTVLRGMALTWGEGRRLKELLQQQERLPCLHDSDGKGNKRQAVIQKQSVLL